MAHYFDRAPKPADVNDVANAIFDGPGEPDFARGTPLVWNWTESEHTDGRTRFTILKGGSHVHLEGSEWYTDGGPQRPEVSLKFLRAGPPIERSSAIGFRCAVDLDTK